MVLQRLHPEQVFPPLLLAKETSGVEFLESVTMTERGYYGLHVHVVLDIP